MASNRKGKGGNGGVGVTKADLIWSALMVIMILYAAGSGMLP